MKSTLKSGIIQSLSAILAAIIGVVAGKNMEQKNIQNQINEVMGNITNITGGENITINNVSDLAEEYLKILEAYSTLQNNSLVTVDGNSTVILEKTKIIGYENNNSNNFQYDINNNKDLQNANSLLESSEVEQNEIPMTVSYQVNPIQNSEKRNILITASTSFPADYVTISIISDEDEKNETSFNMYGEKNNWYSNVNFCIDRTYEITIIATDSEKEAIYNTIAYVY